MASNAAIEGASGAMGGIIALLATYPLMTVLILTDDAVRAFSCRAHNQPLNRRNVTDGRT